MPPVDHDNTPLLGFKPRCRSRRPRAASSLGPRPRRQSCAGSRVAGGPRRRLRPPRTVANTPHGRAAVRRGPLREGHPREPVVAPPVSCRSPAPIRCPPDTWNPITLLSRLEADKLLFVYLPRGHGTTSRGAPSGSLGGDHKIPITIPTPHGTRCDATTDDETKGVDHEHAEPHTTDHARVRHVPTVPAGSTGAGSPGVEATSDRAQAQAPSPPPGTGTDVGVDDEWSQPQIGQLGQLIAEQTEL